MVNSTRSVSKTNKETNIDKLDEESGKENSIFGSEDEQRRWVEDWSQKFMTIINQNQLN